MSYVDDILIISASPALLRSTTDKTLNMLSSKGFIISPYPKTISVPSTSIDWLGKHIHSDKSGIYVSTPNQVLALIASLIIFCRSKKGPARIIRTICGIISWCNCHIRLAFPFIHHARYIAHHNMKHSRTTWAVRT